MSETAEVQTMLDLSRLPYETRLRVVVLAVGWGGAIWQHAGGVFWHLSIGQDPARPQRVFAEFWTNDSDFRWRPDAPDPFNNPAAWGALMEREMARWETGEFDGKRMHRCWWLSGDDVTLSPGPWASSIGWAVCLAVLAKHGITVEP